MNNHTLTPKYLSIGEVFSNGKRYEIPAYQRDYSWRLEHWEDLWLDLEEAETSRKPHYMGSIVLVQKSHHLFQIIDGQQRLVTLSLLVISALRFLKKTEEEYLGTKEEGKRWTKLRDSLLGSQNPVSLRQEPRLFLNKRDNPFYESYLVNLKDPIVHKAALKGADKLLWEAIEFFEIKIKEKFSKISDLNLRAEKISAYLYDFFAVNVVFVVISVEDEVSAYAFFETLNARGVELTAGDLLKNYLLSVVSQAGESQICSALVRWDRIFNSIPSKESTAFLRHYLNSRMQLVRRDRVYKTIKESYKSPSEAFDLIEGLEKVSLIHLALDDPMPDFFNDPKVHESARRLKMYRVTQYRPLIFAAYNRLTFEETGAILKALDILSFRYHVICEKSTNKIEDIYNQIALNVFKNEYTSSRQVIAALKPLYVPDDEFVESFSKKEISSRSYPKLVRYILFEINRQMYQQTYSYENHSASIEHVLPENPDESWLKDFSSEKALNYTSRLGNYLLLEPKSNRECSNLSFNEKKEKYLLSEYKLTSELKYDEWTPSIIEERQRKLAKVATSIWKIEGL